MRLLQIDGGAGLFEIGLELVGLGAVDALLDRLWRLVDERLGLLEAEAGRRYLIGRGVPADAVIAVGEGNDTLGSLRAVDARAQQDGWDSALVVSDPWHSLRARTMARDGVLARRTGERSLDLLLMLQLKTYGNLDETERDVLNRAAETIRERLAAFPQTLDA